MDIRTGTTVWSPFGSVYVMRFLVVTPVARALILATIPSSVTEG
jgi:hypothetical protein